MKSFYKLLITGFVVLSLSSVNPIAASGAGFSVNSTKLNFTAKTVEGVKYSSKVLANKKPTVIWFWAPWCAICKNESAYMIEAAAKYKGKVNFVGIGALGTGDEMKEFVTHTGTSSFTNLNDSEGKLWNRFGVILQPTLIFVDSQGKITSHVGPSEEDLLNKKITALLRKK